MTVVALIDDNSRVHIDNAHEIDLVFVECVISLQHISCINIFIISIMWNVSRYFFYLTPGRVSFYLFVSTSCYSVKLKNEMSF